MTEAALVILFAVANRLIRAYWFAIISASIYVAAFLFFLLQSMSAKRPLLSVLLVLIWESLNGAALVFEFCYWGVFVFLNLRRCFVLCGCSCFGAMVVKEC